MDLRLLNRVVLLFLYYGLINCEQTTIISEAVPECGLVEELQPGAEFPWHVSIYWHWPGRGLTQICGGTLVRADLVVTAAHCFDHLESKHDPRNVTVVAGKLNRPIFNEPMQQKSTVNTIIIPETYDSSWTHYEDDIAVAILNTGFIYNDFVRPICLDFDQDLDKLQLSPGNLGRVVGWGLTEKNTPSSTLKVVELPIISRTTCRGLALSDNHQYLTGDKICAGYTNDTAICRGDSGGGLVFPRLEANSRKRYFLRGVVSIAVKPQDPERGCDLDMAAVFTRVSALHHERFLKNILNDVNAFRRSAVCLPINASLVPEKSLQKSWNKCIEYQEKLVYPCELPVDADPTAPVSRQDYCTHEQGADTGALGVERDAVEGEFPFLAVLTDYAVVKKNCWQYPATILNERFILTSAWRAGIRYKWARIRVHRIGDIPESRDLYRIVRTIPHPEYKDSATWYHDVGLVETDRPMELDRFAVPACLDSKSGVALDAVTALRWSPPKFGELKKVTLPRVLGSLCEAKHPDLLRRGFDNDTMMCYNNTVHFENPFSYGAPIVVRSSSFGCMYSVVGVVVGYRDWSLLGVYARVQHYTPWIESIVWPLGDLQ